jgi:TonB family protein
VEEVQDMKPAMLAPGGVQPVFPFQLLSENVTGSVVVEVLVDATGHADVNTARVVRSSHPLFTAAVMRALPTMRFVPAEAHGQKVAQRIEVPFRFDRKTAGQ